MTNVVTAIPELQIKLNIVARSITYFPGDRLQFRKPRFFQDQAQRAANILFVIYQQDSFVRHVDCLQLERLPAASRETPRRPILDPRGPGE